MLRFRSFCLAAVLVFILGLSTAFAAPEYVMFDIIDWANNDGISWSTFPGDQDLDGVGFGFPAEELPQDDFTLAWDADNDVPFMAFYMEDGWGNNIEAWGEMIDLPEGRYSGLWLLVVTHHGGIDTTLVLNYADGSQAEYAMKTGDWCGDPLAGERMLLRPAYRHGADGRTGPSCGFWLLPRFDTDSSKQLVSMTLPDEERLHIFGVTLEK